MLRLPLLNPLGCSIWYFKEISSTEEVFSDTLILLDTALTAQLTYISLLTLRAGEKLARQDNDHTSAGQIMFLPGVRLGENHTSWFLALSSKWASPALSYTGRCDLSWQEVLANLLGWLAGLAISPMDHSSSVILKTSDCHLSLTPFLGNCPLGIGSLSPIFLLSS